MRHQKKRYFLTSFLAVLFVGIGFWGYATGQTPVTDPSVKNKTAELANKEKNILIRGAITHVREPDGSSNAINGGLLPQVQNSLKVSIDI